MTHVMDPTVKIWLGYGRDEEPAEKAILFDKETTRSPLPSAPTVDRISSSVHLGVSDDGRFVGRGARNQEPDGNTRRRDNDLDRFRLSSRRNTLHPVSFVDYIDNERSLG